MKDYKLLYEATKLDLRDQINHSVSLETEVDRLNAQVTSIMTNDVVHLRERIAGIVARSGWYISTAQEMYDWVSGEKTAENPVKINKGKRGPYKKINRSAAGSKMRDAVKPKRKYTKKSKFWAKKKK